MSNPFLDPALARDVLYADASRLRHRTGALHAAKTVGSNATDTITDLVAARTARRPVVADVGCGRGTTTRHLADRLDPRTIFAIDASPALLAVVAHRVSEATCIAADFHRLPFGDRSCHAIVAAFCLYHSPRPGDAVAELGRCLTPDGVAVLATKSANSYTELDAIVAGSDLDPDAACRPSLYTSFHADNAATIARKTFTTVTVRRERHEFTFTGYAHLAAYLATTPRYRLTTGTDPADIEAALHRWRPERPITTSSTVAYIIASGPR